MPKPLPDFASPAWERMSPRAKLYAIREFLLNRSEPLAIEDVRRLMRWMFLFSIELVAESHMASKYALDQVEVARLLHAEAALYEASLAPETTA